jgi:hypothetical protein
MSPAKTSTLRETFSDILANLAFMFSDDEVPAVLAGESWYETAIRYDGPRHGRLRLWCPQSFMTRLAANLLGVDPQEPETDVKGIDAVKELMNILCGQLVTEFHGGDAIFNLSIPECHRLEAAPRLGGPDDDDAFTLAVNGSGVRLVHTLLPGAERNA